MEDYTVPSQRGNEISLKTIIRDHLSTLDVVWANKFEGENISPENAKEKEAEFYRGAPPQWLNFYWAEKEGSPIVKRDLYEVIWKKIDINKQTSRSITHVNLFHQPGSGGSTLAMQILWDLRKKLRCAKIVTSTTDTKAAAYQVVQLFNAGGPENQNTVLLLLDDTSDDPSFQKNLEDNLVDEIKARNFPATVPVVIILNCVRQLTATKSTTLCRSLSEEEKNKLKENQAEIIQRHGDRHTKFHAFNIMLSNYSPSVVTEICKILHPIKKKKRPRKAQLLAYLALINSYVPGSSLSRDLCQQFLENNSNTLDEFSLEVQMQPFTDILVIFSTQTRENRSEDHVRMAHPMIADECLQLLTSAALTRSVITRNLLTDLCKNPVPLYLVKTIKKMLTKRETIQDKDKFSRLIQDIKAKESTHMCVLVLKSASKKLDQDPFLPQALARFYYIEENDYKRGENWAKTAIERDEKNSFIRDTLGQVHKNHLKNLVLNAECSSRQILHTGKKATESFEDEAEAAVKEQAPEMKDHGMTNISNSFNNRGLYGFMEAADIIFYHLTKKNMGWSEVLTQEITPQTFFKSCLGEKCEKYTALLISLKDEVEKTFEFFEQYLTYSKPSIDNDEPSYFWPTIEKCYNKYVTKSGQRKTALQMLKEKKVSTFAGLLNAPDLDLELITEQLRELHLHSPSDADAVQKYILANIILSQRNATSPVLRPLGELQNLLKGFWKEQKDKRSPEFYLLVLLLFWPSEEQVKENSPDISECVKYMHESFERTYQNYLRSRFLVPLFLLRGGQGLQKLVHTSQIDKTDIDHIHKGDESARIPGLQRVHGRVQSYKVFYVKGLKEIEVSPQHPASVRRQGQVSFFLGFNIKGPVAYNIRYEQ
ncbi:sterile alpha motif domain-containing protein 9-like [Pygocentrus nattereri]|uniref:sterile alpha motif domain-containing protein 9-like n=1 Tax=Pygocentrus nattereri TaxID=42514 RepID=UPI001890EE36|nr:sterile alpha motif domain-containing protein 9-like [Pygocentrus nattereri]